MTLADANRKTDILWFSITINNTITELLWNWYNHFSSKLLQEHGKSICGKEKDWKGQKMYHFLHRHEETEWCEVISVKPLNWPKLARLMRPG